MLQRRILGDVYGEDGCRYASACQICPMPDCMLGAHKRGGSRRIHESQVAFMREAKGAGMTTFAIGEKLGVCDVTVQKYLKGTRKVASR